VHLAVESPFGRPFVLASLTMVCIAGALLAVALRQATPSTVDMRATEGVLWVACAVLALVTSFVSCLRWRMVGDSTSLRIGAAMLAIAALVVVIDVVPFVERDIRVGIGLQRLDAAMTIVLVALLVVAVLARPIDSHASPARLTATLVIATMLLVLLQSVVSLRSFRHDEVRVDGALDVVVAIIMVFGVTVLACIALARGAKQRSWLWAWLGLGLIAFGIARVLNMCAHRAHDTWTIAGVILGICGLLCILYGMAQELRCAFFEQRDQLFDQKIDAEVDEARERADRLRREERAHEARSAVFALRAAIAALTPVADDIGSREQPSARDALLAEIELLRHLVVDEPARSSREFDVADSVLPVVVCHRACGLDVDARLPGDLRVVGDQAELAEVVQGLLDNARDHAPGARVTIRAVRRGNDVELRVADDGPGIPAHQRERVFERGASTRAVDGGLGLYVARRLLGARGGSLRVDSGPGGGAVFLVTLPAASSRRAVARDEHVLHDCHDVARAFDRDTAEVLSREQ
jgi:signal transduction histidine kinase